jgi:hypothetical protein
VILQFAGERVRSVAQMDRLILETPRERAVKIKTSRNRKLEKLEATVENRAPNCLFSMPTIPEFKLRPLPNAKLLPPRQTRPLLVPAPKAKIIPLPPVTPFNSPFSAVERVLGISGDNLTPQLASFFGV